MNELLFCTNLRATGGQPSCAGRGSIELANEVENWINEKGLNLTVDRSVCLGHCHEGPNVRIVPGGEFIHEATLAKVISAINKL
jgi:NADH:ubiquinone oxidoreductase subunit E